MCTELLDVVEGSLTSLATLAVAHMMLRCVVGVNVQSGRNLSQVPLLVTCGGTKGAVEKQTSTEHQNRLTNRLWTRGAAQLPLHKQNRTQVVPNSERCTAEHTLLNSSSAGNGRLTESWCTVWHGQFALSMTAESVHRVHGCSPSSRSGRAQRAHSTKL